MSKIVVVQEDGSFSLPPDLVEKYDIKDGDVYQLLDLGGIFILSNKKTEAPRLLAERQQDISSFLQDLRAERSRYVFEQYGIETDPND